MPFEEERPRDMRTSMDLSLVTDWGFVTADITIGARKESLKFREAYAASEGIKNRGSDEFSGMVVNFLVTPLRSALRRVFKKSHSLILLSRKFISPHNKILLWRPSDHRVAEKKIAD